MKTRNLFIVALMILGANSIAQTETGPKTKFIVGETYGGGIIIYVDSTGQHGLIAATSDQSTGIEWYNGKYIRTSATGSKIGTGKANTDAIIAAQGPGKYAASICDQLVINGYDDWFLPSKEELNLVYLQKASGVLVYFLNKAYWSSTESGANFTWYQYFDNGKQGINGKNFTGCVRAVRAF